MRFRKHKRGFTLIEVMLVLVILGGLAALAVVVLGSGRQDKANRDMTKIRIDNIIRQLVLYKSDMGGGRNDYPSDEQGGLKALVTKPAFDDATKGEKWAGPYLGDKDIKDYWGKDFRYELVEKDGKMMPRVSSDGPDGEQGTDDDVKSWSEDEA